MRLALSFNLIHAWRGGIESRLAQVQRFDAEGGITSIDSLGHIDVSAPVVELGRV